MVGVNDHRKLCAYAIKIKPLMSLSAWLVISIDDMRGNNAL